MTMFAIACFVLSLALLVALFALKYRETATGLVYAPRMRARADHVALKAKARIWRINHDLAKIPPITVIYLRYLVHEGALAFASSARAAERGAHRVADLVSHKRTFSPREVRSEFLRQVSAIREDRPVDPVPAEDTFAADDDTVSAYAPIGTTVEREPEESMPETPVAEVHPAKRKRAYHRRRPHKDGETSHEIV